MANENTDSLEESSSEERREKIDEQLYNFDGWNTRPSQVFGGYLEIVKTRKDGDPLSIHINLESGRVRKFAGESLFNPRIDKELRMWLAAKDIFDIKDDLSRGSVTRLKKDPSKGYEEIAYLEMPYMGVPIDYYERVTSRKVGHKAIERFREKMKRLVEVHGIFFPDMNPGNVLVRVVDGEEVLCPIDWESAQTNRVRSNTEYYASETLKRCNHLFGIE